MGNPFLWAQARRIDNTLQGDDWPKHMTPAQIAKLHFYNDEGSRKTLQTLRYKKADSGGIEFDEIIETYSLHDGSVSIGYAGQSSLAADFIRDIYRETRDQHLSETHRPDCGWGAFLKGIAPGESIQLAHHTCSCEAICAVTKVYHNGLPKRWSVNGIHSDGFKIEFSCFAEPMLTVNQYHAFCMDNGIPPIPSDSPLIGWEPTALTLSQEELDRQEVQAIATEWLLTFPSKEYPFLTTRAAKKHPKLIPYYEKYPGHDPVKPDEWLVEVGVPRGKMGGKAMPKKNL